MSCNSVETHTTPTQNFELLKESLQSSYSCVGLSSLPMDVAEGNENANVEGDIAIVRLTPKEVFLKLKIIRGNKERKHQLFGKNLQ